MMHKLKKEGCFHLFSGIFVKSYQRFKKNVHIDKYYVWFQERYSTQLLQIPDTHTPTLKNHRVPPSFQFDFVSVFRSGLNWLYFTESA